MSCPRREIVERDANVTEKEELVCKLLGKSKKISDDPNTTWENN